MPSVEKKNTGRIRRARAGVCWVCVGLLGGFECCLIVAVLCRFAVLLGRRSFLFFLNRTHSFFCVFLFIKSSAGVCTHAHSNFFTEGCFWEGTGVISNNNQMLSCRLFGVAVGVWVGAMRQEALYVRPARRVCAYSISVSCVPRLSVCVHVPNVRRFLSGLCMAALKVDPRPMRRVCAYVCVLYILSIIIIVKLCMRRRDRFFVRGWEDPLREHCWLPFRLALVCLSLLVHLPVVERGGEFRSILPPLG